MHKAIRRMTPAPRARVPKGEVFTDNSRPSERKLDAGTANNDDAEHRKMSAAELSTSPKVATFMMRRRSSGNQGTIEQVNGPMALRSDDPEIKKHLKHLGPSNAATKPKSTHIKSVKIKPGIPNTIPENANRPHEVVSAQSDHASL